MTVFEYVVDEFIDGKERVESGFFQLELGDDFELEELLDVTEEKVLVKMGYGGHDREEEVLASGVLLWVQAADDEGELPVEDGRDLVLDDHEEIRSR